MATTISDIPLTKLADSNIKQQCTNRAEDLHSVESRRRQRQHVHGLTDADLWLAMQLWTMSHVNVHINWWSIGLQMVKHSNLCQTIIGS